MPSYPGSWYAQPSLPIHPASPRFVLCSLLFPACPPFPGGSQPAAGNCSPPPLSPASMFCVQQVALLIRLPHCFFRSPYLPLPLPVITLMKAEKMGEGARNSLRGDSLIRLFWLGARKLAQSVWEVSWGRCSQDPADREWQTFTGARGPRRKKIAFIGSIYLQLSEKGKGSFPQCKQASAMLLPTRYFRVLQAADDEMIPNVTSSICFQSRN